MQLHDRIALIQNDGMIWTSGTAWHSSNQKKVISWSHPATPGNQTS